ncbi:thiamine pyrophosphate-binding protein [Jannaschia aquimarina]|uniref:AlsS protein n=1 Tax=Jannaschia aquimarina TaxID=935700 RepID=A0A0D1EF35_9RHOB|nr:thiamine pyrophosphate-binding protein [Jannaschia aquimarina]KIT16254.1 Acetolactate synthase [Jannaschia aquimarina]SNT15202.1 acetolactate synthase-1/2/3 large subunit [Jannaschia aquimarina]
MNLSDVCARYLREAGIGTVFGYPGDPSVGFLEALRTEGHDFVLARREGTAGLMAEAAGMLTGKPGVCLSTLGPGSTNLVNAVANAWLDRVPMIALSGQIDTKRAPTFTHQVVDQRALFAPVSKWAAEVAPNTVGHVLRKAHRTAMAPRPGPVHLTMHADHVTAEAQDDAILVPPTETAASVLIHSGTMPERRIAEARRPLILFGISAMQDGCGEQIVALADRIGAAIVAGPMAKGTVSEDHPRFAGTLDMACQAPMWDFLKSADLVICAGFDAVELIKPWSVTAPVIHIDRVPNTDQIYAAETEMTGPIGPILAMLADAVPESDGWPEKDIAAHRDALRADFDSGRVSGALNPSDVIRVARDVLPADTIASVDVGSHKLLVGQGWRPSGPRRFLMTNGLSSMGFSLPAGIAAKHLMPDAPVVSFMGDGGLAMVQGELRLAASLKLGLKVVVFVDNSLNRIELKQMARQVPSTGTVIEETAIVPLAVSMGCHGVMADTESALQDALSTDTGDVPLVIGARIDPAQYAAQF